MSIRLISTEQLRRMGDQEGLVLQGCGGDPQEWLDGINEILAQECILKKGAGFEEAYTFRRDGLTCMLFPFKENMELDVGKLAVWRLASYSAFGGTWLFDFLLNVVKEVIIKEFSEGNFQPIAELLQRNHAGILTLGVEHAVNGGGGHPGTAGKGIDGDTSFVAQSQNPGCDSFFRIHKTSSSCTIYR